jgi:hypothetical protein
MTMKGGQNAKKPNRTRAKVIKTEGSLRKAKSSRPTGTEDDTAAKRFVNDLVVRGEAATPTKEGRLPLDATHVITKKNKDGTIEVKRVRYKAF